MLGLEALEEGDNVALEDSWPVAGGREGGVNYKDDSCLLRRLLLLEGGGRHGESVRCAGAVADDGE